MRTQPLKLLNTGSWVVRTFSRRVTGGTAYALVLYGKPIIGIVWRTHYWDYVETHYWYYMEAAVVVSRVSRAGLLRDIHNILVFTEFWFLPKL